MFLGGGFYMFLEDRKEAETLLEWASEQNPGPWVDHSKYVALAAERIAIELQQNGFDINPDIAYNCGILHDIGRYVGVTDSIIHSYDGYIFLKEKGYEGNANVAVSHSFPIRLNRIETLNGWDLVPPPMQEEFITILSEMEFTIYDDLITLCDALAESTGFTIMERRIVSASIRNGVTADLPNHWKGYFEIKDQLEGFIGKSIYSLLPGIEESVYKPLALSNQRG